MDMTAEVAREVIVVISVLLETVVKEITMMVKVIAMVMVMGTVIEKTMRVKVMAMATVIEVTFAFQSMMEQISISCPFSSFLCVFLCVFCVCFFSSEDLEADETTT